MGAGKEQAGVWERGVQAGTGQGSGCGKQAAKAGEAGGGPGSWGLAGTLVSLLATFGLDSDAA